MTEPARPATTPAPVVSAKGVSLRYGKTLALDGVDLDIPQGITVGLIGPDGVGKSSLLSLIAGARVVQEGRIDVLGGDIADARHRNRVCPRIAYMPQGLGKNLYFNLSIFENVDFFGRLFGHDRAEREERIADLLAHRRPAGAHAPHPVRRPAGGQALRRHEAEARPVLLADPRSGLPDPG